MDIGSTITRIKGEFKKYLRDTHHHWSDSTVSTHTSDAFYIWNNTITTSFWKCLKDASSMAYAKEEMLRYLKEEKNSSRAEERVASYYADLSLLKEFLDTTYGGVEAAVGDEYNCEAVIYDYAKMLYEGSISQDDAVAALCEKVPCFSEASHKIIIGTFAVMMEGKQYTRRANTETTMFFIEQIGKDYGIAQMRVALDATKQNILYYYKQTGSKSKSFCRGCAEIARKHNIDISFGDEIFDGIEVKEKDAEIGDAIGDKDVRTTHYWIYSPGYGASKWEQFYSDGVMAIAREYLGDLGQYATRKQIQDEMKLHGTESGAVNYQNASLEAWQFVHDMKPGDVVFAKSGQKTILGRGVVTSGYFYDENCPDGYNNLRKINWTHKGEWEHPGKAVTKVLTDITAYTEYVEQLCRLFDDESDPGVEETEYPVYTEQDFLADVYMGAEEYATLVELIRTKKNVILQGAPGVGKTFAAKRLAYSMMGVKDQNRVMMIQFHQSYSYEDFIMGFRPSEAGFELKKGAFYNFCKKAELDRDNEYFFIIDEINRGNLSKIFGELFMLIESDKRGIQLQLLYSDEKFAVPQNVYIIGMMNTADRSLAMLDYALRRRFAFYEMRPGFETDGFRQYRMALGNDKFNNLIHCVESLNAVISADDSLGDGFCIGHSYFCNLADDAITDRTLSGIVEYELIPLLKEYWFDEPLKVKDWTNNLRSAIK